MRLRLLVLLAALVVALPPGSRTSVASAHALLVSAEPAVNASVQQAPRELTLYFSEPLERKFSNVQVTDEDGRRLDQAVSFDAANSAVMRVSVAEAGPGYLVVSWETVSVVDGHRIAGSYPVTILNPDGSTPAAVPPASTTVQGDEAQLDLIAAKFFLLAAGCLLAGALLFSLAVTPVLPGEAGTRARAAADRRGVVAATLALVVIAVASALELVFQASNIGSSLGDVLSTRWGERWLLRAAFFGATLLALLPALLARRPSPPRRPLMIAALLAAATALATVSSTSHAAAGEGAFWAAATDFAHLLAASVWIGMLAMLALLFAWARRALESHLRQAVLSTALQRFSVAAAVSLSLLVFTGTLSAVIEVARLSDLVETAYGRILFLKLLLLLPLLAVAAYNAYVLRPAYATKSSAAASLPRGGGPQRGGPRSRMPYADSEAGSPSPRRERGPGGEEAPVSGAPTTFPLSTGGEGAGGGVERHLTRTIRLEAALAIAVLTLVAVLVQINPPRAGIVAQPESQTFTETKPVQDIGVTLTIAPNLPGINTFEVALTGETRFVQQVRLEFFDRSGVTSESRLVLDAATPLTAYSGNGPFLGAAGDWQVRVNLRRSQGNDLSLPFDLTVGGTTVRDRGGTFDSPVSWSPARVALVALSAAVLGALLLATLHRHERGGHIAGYLARRRGG